MKTQLHVLNDLRTDEGLGIEGWFKIELYHALRKHGVAVKIKNKGPDLVFDDSMLELKAAQSKTAPWVRREGLKYLGVDCLFLGPVDLVESVSPYYYGVIDDYWIVGLITKDISGNISLLS